VYDAKIDANCLATITVGLPGGAWQQYGWFTGTRWYCSPILLVAGTRVVLVVLYRPYWATLDTTQYGGVTATTLWKTTTVLKILAKISSELMNHELIPKIPLGWYY
jgi:hypothetical protein